MSFKWEQSELLINARCLGISKNVDQMIGLCIQPSSVALHQEYVRCTCVQPSSVALHQEYVRCTCVQPSSVALHQQYVRCTCVQNEYIVHVIDLVWVVLKKMIVFVNEYAKFNIYSLYVNTGAFCLSTMMDITKFPVRESSPDQKKVKTVRKSIRKPCTYFV